VTHHTQALSGTGRLRPRPRRVTCRLTRCLTAALAAASARPGWSTMNAVPTGRPTSTGLYTTRTSAAGMRMYVHAYMAWGPTNNMLG
jgi:hypothetical protein